MKSLKQYIFEKYGEYEGQFEFAHDLAENIMRFDKDDGPYDISGDSFNDLKNIFFNNLRVVFANVHNGYMPRKSKIDPVTGNFDIVEIQFDPSQLTDLDAATEIVNHEILHAWNDYKTKLQDGVATIEQKTSWRSKYAKTILNGLENAPQTVAKKVLNLITKMEQNAYFSEIAIALKKANIKDKELDFAKAKEIIESSGGWRQFYETELYYRWMTNSQSLFSDKESVKSLEDYKKDNPLTNEERQEFYDTINRINKTKKNPNQIRKSLDAQWQKIYDKMKKRECQIYCDWVEKQNETKQKTNR